MKGASRRVAASINPTMEGDAIMDSPRKRVAYDPDQDPEEKRVLRQKYRVLLKDEEGRRASQIVIAGEGGLTYWSPLSLFRLGHQINANEYTTQELLEKVQLADSLFDQGVCVFSHVQRSRPSRLFLCSLIHLQVFAPQEATLDSAFLVTASNMHAAKARAMKAGAGAFDIDDFVSKLITFMGGRRGEAGPKDRESGGTDEDEEEEEEDYDDNDEPLDWEKIGRKALAKSRRVPVMDFMCVPPRLLTCARPDARGRRTGSGHLRLNKRSASLASALNSRRIKTTSGGRRNCAKKILHDPRTRQRSM